MLPKLPDKNYSAKDQRARWVCFQIPNLWAKKGGTCNPTADISSLRHAAHFRVCRRLSRDFCSHAKIIGWLSPVIVHKLTAASSMEQWTCHWQSEKWRYERMRIILTCSTCIWYGSRNLGTAFMLQLCGNIFYFDFSPVGMNPYQTDVVTHRNSGVPVKCILGIFNGIYSEQTGVPQEFVGSSSAWCLRILGRHPAINLLPPHAVETVVGLENMKLSMGEVFVLDLP